MIVTKDQIVPVEERLEAFFEVDDAPLAAHMTVVQGPSVSETVLKLFVSPVICRVIHNRGT